MCSTFPPVTVDELLCPLSRPAPLVTWSPFTSSLTHSFLLYHQFSSVIHHSHQNTRYNILYLNKQKLLGQNVPFSSVPFLCLPYDKLLGRVVCTCCLWFFSLDSPLGSDFCRCHFIETALAKETHDLPGAKYNAPVSVQSCDTIRKVDNSILPDRIPHLAFRPSHSPSFSVLCVAALLSLLC